jgi:glutamate-5-semialdehyde dehydrogenase
LKAALEEVATVPVIYAASGNCHVYVDASADPDQARAIVLNAKTQRPGVCNAAETLLIHEQIAAEFVPQIVRALGDAGVSVRADERSLALATPGTVAFDLPEAPDGAGLGAGHEPAGRIAAATEEDWATEYLAMTLAVKVVDTTEDAIEHIARYGSGHSEAIVTKDTDSARAFQLGVDAACVYVNASTRFTDGGEFGMGAEIGNSTQKLHVRGPIGLRELCTFKYLIEGDGHVRL